MCNNLRAWGTQLLTSYNLVYLKTLVCPKIVVGDISTALTFPTFPVTSNVMFMIGHHCTAGSKLWLHHKPHKRYSHSNQVW